MAFPLLLSAMMMPKAITSLVVLATAVMACSSGGNPGFSSGSAGNPSTGSSSGGKSGPNGSSSSSGSSGPSLGSSSGNSTPPSGGCSPNPQNAEIADNKCDDDGDGTVDNVPTCDQGLAIDGPADSFAKAIGICESASARGFGLVSATYSNGYGRTTAPHDGQWGILPKFGNVIVPREGKMLGALSSGYAREFDATDGTQAAFTNAAALDGTNYPTGQAPNGYPKPAAGCTQDSKVNDMIDVKLVVQAPPNAQGFTFDFDFHSSEWPDYVCTEFNDAFIVFLKSAAFNSGTPENVSFDSKNNPVSVNNGFFDRCTPNTHTGCDGLSNGVSTCPGGPNELAGTGFGLTAETSCDNPQTATMGGATGWLTSQAPIKAGETFTLEFMIWDTGDGVLDSSVLIDKFRWVGAPVSAPETTRPPK